MTAVFQLRAGAPSQHVSGVAIYLGYEASVLGCPCLINQWSAIAIPYVDARPARFDVHFLGQTFTRLGHFAHQEIALRTKLLAMASAQVREDLAL